MLAEGSGSMVRILDQRDQLSPQMASEMKMGDRQGGDFRVGGKFPGIIAQGNQRDIPGNLIVEGV